MSFFRRLFGARRPVPPVLLRVRAASGALPEQVALEVAWSSGRRERRQVVAAQGLCILPWRVDEAWVEIAVRALGARGELRVTARENASGAVHEVRLTDELAAE